jgi:hypothetical protein
MKTLLIALCWFSALLLFALSLHAEILQEDKAPRLHRHAGSTLNAEARPSQIREVDHAKPGS